MELKQHDKREAGYSITDTFLFISYQVSVLQLVWAPSAQHVGCGFLVRLPLPNLSNLKLSSNWQYSI
jgi:hypothetical protein